YSSTTSSAVCCNSRGDTSGWFNASVKLVISSSSVELMKLSLLSTSSAIRGRFFFVHHLRILRRDNHRALNLSVAHVLPRLHFVVIRDRDKRPHIRPHRVKRFSDPNRLRPMIFIHDSHLRVADLSAESISQDDQLHQRHHHRYHHERRRPEKLPHLSLDNRHHPVHGCNPGLCGIWYPYAFTSSSRSCRPV